METAGSALHITTPCIRSHSLSHIASKDVFLKLENLQPTRSFKIRGIGRLCEQAALRGNMEIVCSSGGNAGLAAAYSAAVLKLRCTVFTPTSTPDPVVQMLTEHGAIVKVTGSNWDEANTAALRYASDTHGSCFVHPFQHPVIWEGHATMVDELMAQLSERPAAVVTAVGGGGLANGLLLGMDRVGWSDVPLVAMKTKGADCFNAAVTAGERVVLKEITSIATTLGALQVSQQLYDSFYCRQIYSRVVTDQQAAHAAVCFAEDHGMLVESSCGAALAAVYSGQLPEAITARPGPVVVVACGGSAISAELIVHWKSQLHSHSDCDSNSGTTTTGAPFQK